MVALFALLLLSHQALSSPWDADRLDKRVPSTLLPADVDLSLEDPSRLAVSFGAPEGGVLVPRQQRVCLNPGYVPICPQNPTAPCCPPTHTVCCPSAGVCCQPGLTCPIPGSVLCCLASETPCGVNTCCSIGETCQAGRCIRPQPSTTSTRSTSSTRPIPEPTFSIDPPSSDLSFTEIDVNDPKIIYDGPWKDDGGLCRNGTKTSTEIGSKITFKFLGNKLSIVTIPGEDGAKYKVSINGVDLAPSVLHDTRAIIASGCDKDSLELWRSDFNEEVEITITHDGLGQSFLGESRAPPLLEFAGFRTTANGRPGNSGGGGFASASSRSHPLGIVSLTLLVSLVSLSF